MNVVCIRAYEVEKQYEEFYDNAKLHYLNSHSPKLGDEKSLRDTYSKAWIRLLSSNIKNK